MKNNICPFCKETNVITPVLLTDIEPKSHTFNSIKNKLCMLQNKLLNTLIDQNMIKDKLYHILSTCTKYDNKDALAELKLFKTDTIDLWIMKLQLAFNRTKNPSDEFLQHVLNFDFDLKKLGLLTRDHHILVEQNKLKIVNQPITTVKDETSITFTCGPHTCTIINENYYEFTVLTYDIYEEDFLVYITDLKKYERRLEYATSKKKIYTISPLGMFTKIHIGEKEIKIGFEIFDVDYGQEKFSDSFKRI